MAYQAPTITAAGLSIPSFNDVLSFYTSSFLSIYGQQIVLSNDNPDFQFMAALAASASDTMQGVALAYNSRSPSVAIGSALDAVIKMNGLVRLPATYSTCAVTITGTPATVITNGQIRDINGNLWNLPASVTIPGGGTTSQQVTASDAGAVSANPGDLSTIATPTAGWISVQNSTAAIPGQPIEPDSRLRARQAISVALPSRTRLAGTIAGLEQTLNVSRVAVLENATSALDANSLPPHSITAIVEGGTDLDVATTIFNNRGIGPYTNGNVAVTVVDPATQFLTEIRFDRPTYVAPYVSITVHGTTGFTSATVTQIQKDIVAYLNALEIGANVTYGEIWGAALNARSNPDAPIFAIRSVFLGLTPSPTGTSDLTLAYYQVSEGLMANVVVTTV